jgi:DNA repair protein RAD50
LSIISDPAISRKLATMSSFVDMNIMGVRSFDSMGNGETIKFLTPLTLIVGTNGCGKTTIIECLKYSATGILPPGAKTGGAFIHDPRLNGETHSFAKIQLRIQDTKGERMIANRNLDLTLKKGTRSMKTLEASLKYGGRGDKFTLSKRVAEMDQLLPIHVGASTAVLENVIFCHQEESLWPLGDSASLKKKFDEIFEAQKYTKAIKNIADIRKHHKTQLELQKKDEAHAKEDKDRSIKAKKKSLQLQEGIEKMRTQIAQLGQQMTEAAEKSADAHRESEDFARILGQLEGKRIEAASKRENVHHLRSSLKEVSESDEWLRETLAEFDQRQSELEAAIGEKKQSYVNLGDEITRSRDQLNAKLAERGKYQQEKDEYKRQLARRQTTVREVSAKHNMRGYDDLTDDEQVEDFIHNIKKEYKEKQLALERARRDHNAEKEAARTTINKFAQQRDAVIHNKITANKQIAINNKDSVQFQKKVDAIQVDEASRSTLEARIEELKAKIETQKSLAESSAWPTKLKEANSTLRDLEDNSAQLNHELVQGTKKATDMAQLTNIKRLLKETERNLQTMLAAHSDRIKSVMSQEFEVDDLDRLYRDAVDTATRDHNTAVRERDASKQELDQIIFKLKTARADLDKMRHATKISEDKIRGVTEDEPEEYEQSLREAENAAEDARESGGGGKQLRDHFDRVLEKLNGPNPSCRTCMRAFKGHDDKNLKKTKDRVEGYIKQAIEMEKSARLDEAEEYLKAVLGVRAAYDTWRHNSEAAIPALENQIHSLEQEKDAASSRLDKRESKVDEQDQSRKDLESVSKAVTSITKYNIDFQDYTRQSEELAAKQSQQAGGRTLEDIQEELSTAAEEVRKTKTEIGRLTSEQEQSRSDMSGMNHDLHGLQSQLSATIFELEKKGSLQSRVDEYKVQNQKQREIVDKASSDVEKLDPQIDAAKTKLEDLNDRADIKERELARDASELTSSVQSLDLLNDQIQSYLQRGGDQQLSKVDTAVKALEGDIQSSVTVQGKVAAEANKLQQQLQDSESTKRQYADNLRYREDSRALERLGAEIQQLESHNAEVDRDRLAAESAKWNKRHNLLSAQQSGLMGSMHSDDKQLGDLLQQFEIDLKDAPKRYSAAHMKVETTKYAIEDLTRYGGALDKAIMKYHSLKMDEINDTIHDLWKAVYQGSDIESIRITADGEASAGKKSYNYRVLMDKGDGIEMEMRGRCSAGQKVLASIIIRLALAECFSSHCGIFALDEPTTNLDRDNIEALARALGVIIERRRQQKNFQLIVITHDEEFLRHMHCQDYTDYYYRVSRTQAAKSIIELQAIAEVM